MREIKRNTQKWKILITMLNYPDRRFRPEDFMQYWLWELFVWYEAWPRLSELWKKWFLISIKVENPKNRMAPKKKWKIKKEVIPSLLKKEQFRDYKKYKRLLDWVFNNRKWYKFWKIF